MIELGSTGELKALRDAAVREPELYGARAVRLSRLAAQGLPVPRGIVLPVPLVAKLAAEGPAEPGAGGPDPAGSQKAGAATPGIGAELSAVVAGLGPEALLAVRASPPNPAWGGPHAILNIGVTDADLPALSQRVGPRAARDLYRRLIQSYALGVAGLDDEGFEALLYDRLKLEGAEDETGLDATALDRLLDEYKAHFLAETGARFPQDKATQLLAALTAAARGWTSGTARILRQARGAPENAGLALIVQRMALGLGAVPDDDTPTADCGAGLARFIDDRTGAPGLTGRYLSQAQGQDAMMGLRTPMLLSQDERLAQGQPGLSLEERCPDAVQALRELGAQAAAILGDAQDLAFTLEQGQLWLLDAEPARRSARAAIRVAVELAQAGAIGQDEAILRVDPSSLIQHLHPQIDPSHRAEPIGRGLAASPGAATGRLVFSAEAAIASAAQDHPAILLRIETSPEDVRGMHAAAGLLTLRGGMTSHAAVIARGLGLPCVAGASEISLDARLGTVRTATGLTLREGDVITVDGSSGAVLAGAAPMIRPEMSGAVTTLLDWASARRTLRVRANADTPQDARVAQRFGADGIGLCRTEQMFFEEDRINVMREMILARDAAERRRALDQLLPMQRADFIELFEIMRGLPVTIRLLDPPLHEFLPVSAGEIAAVSAEMGVTPEAIRARSDMLAEVNPMLGKRGVRLAILMPEIYEMQARAIFEATLAVAERSGATVQPEIMIPLVSAAREVDFVRDRIADVAQAVRREHDAEIAYRLGVMVETPRAALRAGDLMRSAAFLSFGTNDLTQMTYGLSRDDAGRFMREYVATGVFGEDPFHALDVEGVGELVLIAAERARAARPDVALGLCGEHGGDPAAIRFCDIAGFDYVSCSPFRMPIAQLAAAQAALLRRVP
ncbi:MAG: pyruvate, phosphate dikinase [Pseudomonadota bacterium]